MTELKRHFNITGAYEFRATADDPRDFGIHHMDMYFAVSGPKGAVNASIALPWYLSQNARGSFDMKSKYPFDPIEELMMPNFTDIGIHSEASLYPDSEWDSERPCHLTDSGKCHYDGTSLWGNESWREGFLHGGSEWLYARLEEYYLYRFEDGPMPNLTSIPRARPSKGK